jgi:hypothetical protein
VRERQICETVLSRCCPRKSGLSGLRVLDSEAVPGARHRPSRSASPPGSPLPSSPRPPRADTPDRLVSSGFRRVVDGKLIPTPDEGRHRGDARPALTRLSHRTHESPCWGTNPRAVGGSSRWAANARLRPARRGAGAAARRGAPAPRRPRFLRDRRAPRGAYFPHVRREARVAASLLHSVGLHRAISRAAGRHLASLMVARSAAGRKAGLAGLPPRDGPPALTADRRACLGRLTCRGRVRYGRAGS